MRNSSAKFLLISIMYVLLVLNGFAQPAQRPFIWATNADRAAILEKIEQQRWAKDFYDQMVSSVQSDLNSYYTNPQEYLSELPFDTSKQQKGKLPPFVHIGEGVNDNSRVHPLLQRLIVATDCSVIYYLTGEERYAQYALDMIHNVILALMETQPNFEYTSNGGWIYPKDHLRESRYMSNLPITYDFLKPFIDSGAKAYNYATGRTEPFAQRESQIVFETYAKLVISQGMIGSNWSVLESPSLVHSALAIEDMEMRNKYLKYYLTENTPKQESLDAISGDYKFKGDIYPETAQYSGAVAALSTHLMYIMTKYNPSLKLGHKYINIPWSLSRWNELVYPNGELILLGDGKRTGGGSLSQYEIAYALGKLDSVTELTDRFGSLISRAAESGYKRPSFEQRNVTRVEPYYAPTQLLWGAEEVVAPSAKITLPRTDNLRHAGVFLQRNLSSTGKAEDGLMLFVGGAAYVHGHATGMHIELYGKGEVLGNDPGHPGYTKDDHENYARLFAAHNTVIVNGASRSDGAWVNLGINMVEKVAMEPEPWTEAISPLYSYSKTSFVDDKGDKAEAIQERTLSVIRTSPTTGYYLDIFRSKSSLPNQYHDYLYHNTADELEILNADINMEPTPERYMANANDAWVQNREFRHPGWHWFKDVKSSRVYTDGVDAIFRAKNIGGKWLNMRLFMLGDSLREYTSVMSPPSYQATKPYDKKPTPVFVVRKKGEAWKNPFVAVFEPTEGNVDKGSVIGVGQILKNGAFKGVKVTSKIEDRVLTQYIIAQDKTELFEDDEIGLSFSGGFAIVTFDENSRLENIYLGEVKSFECKGVSVVSDVQYSDAYIDFKTSVPKVNTNGNPIVKYKNQKL